MNEEKNSPMSQALDMMLELSRKLLNGDISAEVAASGALLGRTIVEGAKETTQFVKVTGFLPRGSVFGDHFRSLEPQATKQALLEQKVRLDNECVKIIPPAKKDQDPWKNYGDAV